MSQMWISFSVAIESSTHTDNKRKAGDETRSLQGLAANVTPVNIPTESGRHMNLFRHQALCKNEQLGTIKKDTENVKRARALFLLPPLPRSETVRYVQRCC